MTKDEFIEEVAFICESPDWVIMPYWRGVLLKTDLKEFDVRKLMAFCLTNGLRINPKSERGWNYVFIVRGFSNK